MANWIDTAAVDLVEALVGGLAPELAPVLDKAVEEVVPLITPFIEKAAGAALAKVAGDIEALVKKYI